MESTQDEIHSQKGEQNRQKANDGHYGCFPSSPTDG
jgi:hypothetical protein